MRNSRSKLARRESRFKTVPLSAAVAIMADQASDKHLINGHEFKSAASSALMMSAAYQTDGDHDAVAVKHAQAVPDAQANFSVYEAVPLGQVKASLTQEALDSVLVTVSEQDKPAFIDDAADQVDAKQVADEPVDDSAPQGDAGDAPADGGGADGSADSSAAADDGGSSGMSAGAIAAIVFGILAAVAAAIGFSGGGSDSEDVEDDPEEPEEPLVPDVALITQGSTKVTLLDAQTFTDGAPLAVSETVEASPLSPIGEVVYTANGFAYTLTSTEVVIHFVNTDGSDNILIADDGAGIIFSEADVNFIPIAVSAVSVGFEAEIVAVLGTIDGEAALIFDDRFDGTDFNSETGLFDTQIPFTLIEGIYDVNDDIDVGSDFEIALVGGEPVVSIHNLTNSENDIFEVSKDEQGEFSIDFAASVVSGNVLEPVDQTTAIANNNPFVVGASFDNGTGDSFLYVIDVQDDNEDLGQLIPFPDLEVLAMDTGDITGDGNDEIVVLLQNETSNFSLQIFEYDEENDEFVGVLDEVTDFIIPDGLSEVDFSLDEIDFALGEITDDQVLDLVGYVKGSANVPFLGGISAQALITMPILPDEENSYQLDSDNFLMTLLIEEGSTFDNDIAKGLIDNIDDHVTAGVVPEGFGEVIEVIPLFAEIG